MTNNFALLRRLRKRQAMLGEQKKHNLAEQRVTPDKPPFTYVGVDHFGSFWVKRVRSLVKRCGALLTCFAVRAVHIKIAHSLDTSSFQHPLRRFIAQLGQPNVIKSEKGTNLVSGQKRIRTAVKECNQNKIHDALTQRHIKLIFNAPIVVAFGRGVLERFAKFSWHFYNSKLLRTNAAYIHA